MMKGKKILVTGGAGFIGSNLCEELVKHNEVWSLDNYFTGSEDNHVDKVIYIRGNTKDIEKSTFGYVTPDIIYHLGEYSRVEQSFDDIQKVWEYNKDGTFAVLEYVRKTGAKLIYAGSSTKFADNGIGKNQSPYAWAKSTNTQLVKNYGEWFGIDYAITYFYNVYGNREISSGKYATLVALFKDKLKNRDKFTVVLPGTQRRNFTHVNDTINGLLLIGEKGHGDGYGIGSATSYSINELAELFAIKAHVSTIQYLPERPGNRMAGPVMTDKIEELGWTQNYHLEDYINELPTNLI